MASRAIVDKLTPLLPKDNEEAVRQVRQLYAMLDAATMTDLALVQEAGMRGQDPGHHWHPRSQSQRSDSTNSSSSSEW
jgi:hypothetical protein